MGELWRDLVELLRQRPVLWLPVLCADLLGYMVNLGRSGVLRAVVQHETAQRSALTGAVVQTPMSASAMQHAAILALLISWFSYLLRVLLYSGALVITAFLVRKYARPVRQNALSLGEMLARSWGGILELALRALAIYAVAALIVSWATPLLSKHGHAAVLRSQWFGYGLTLLVLLILSVALPPVALRVLADRNPDKEATTQSQRFTFGLALIAAVLAAIVGANGRELSAVPPAARYPLEIVGSLVVALPYVLIFTGLSVLAQRLAHEEEPADTLS